MIDTAVGVKPAGWVASAIEMPHTIRFLARVEPLIDPRLDVTRARPPGA